MTAHHAVTVELPAARAFDLFAGELATWWPPEYTWSGDVLDTIAIDPREGGRCFERGPHGFECDWGRVLAAERPQRLLFLWQITAGRVPEPNPEKSSEVEVVFEPDGDSATRVTVEHREFERHGDGAEEYGAMMASPQGWPYLLDRYAAAARESA